jgi:hypothetical protein
MPNHTGLGADLRRGLQQAANGAVEGAVTASLLYHLYNVLTDSPALRDGQYVMFPLITAPPGAVIGAIVGFIRGFLAPDEARAPAQRQAG